MTSSANIALATVFAVLSLGCLCAQVPHGYLRSMHSNPRVRPAVIVYESAIGLHLALMGFYAACMAHGKAAAILQLGDASFALHDALWGNLVVGIVALGFFIAVVDDAGEPDTVDWMPAVEALVVAACTPASMAAFGRAFVIILAIDAAYFIGRLVVLMVYDSRNMRKIVSPLSIVDAMRLLPEGILYADASGKTIIANDTMRGELAALGISADSATVAEIWAELNERAERASMPGFIKERWSSASWVALRSNPNTVRLFVFDGAGFEEKAHRYPSVRPLDMRSPVSKVALDTLGARPYSRIIAFDITHEAEMIVELERANAELSRTQNELLASAEMAREAAENEALLRMRGRVHDVIGQRLSILHRTIEDDAVSDTALAQLQPLLNGVMNDLATDASIDAASAIEATVKAYASIGVEVSVEGELPRDEAIASLYATSLREAVTNAVKHAGAKKVSARSSGHGFEIANDGSVPHGPIVEGTGLSNIRRAVESAGGTLEIRPAPFTLKARFE